MSAFALLIPPADFSIHLQRLTERSSTMQHFLKYTQHFPIRLNVRRRFDIRANALMSALYAEIRISVFK